MIRTVNRDYGPSCFACPKGFITFGSEPNGDAIAVEIASGRVYVLCHEIYSEEGITDYSGRSRSEYLPITAANIAKTAIARFPDIRQFLRQWKADLIERDSEERQFIKAALRDPNATDGFGNHLLIHFIREAAMTAVKQEVRRGADIELINGEGRAALGEAVVFGHPRIAKYLIRCGANVNARGKNGETPLMLAAQYAQVECMALLLESGADANARDHDGWNAFKHLCPVHGTPKMRKLLERYMRKRSRRGLCHGSRC